MLHRWQHLHPALPSRRRQPYPRDVPGNFLEPDRPPVQAPKPRKVNQSFRSWAYALTVFGDRSIEDKYPRNRSTDSIGTWSSPSTVQDSTLSTRDEHTLNPHELPSAALMDS